MSDSSIDGHGMKRPAKRMSSAIDGAYCSGVQTLSGQILRYAGRGITKADFVRKVAKLLLKFSKCEKAETWVKDRERYLYCSVKDNGDTSLSFIKPEEMNKPLPDKTPSGDEAYPALLDVPVFAGRRRMGLVRLSSSRENHFQARSKELRREIADSLGLAVLHVQMRSDLQERIKELTCLYGIARVAAEPDTWLEEVLQRVAQILPAAWLYPDIAGARILYDGHSYATPNYDSSKSVQRAHLVVDGKQRGAIEVAYSEERPELDEGPFLKEERRLLETVAEEVGAIISRREAEREKLRLEDQLRHADRLATLGQLAAGVAHEMNEPLSSVIGFAQLAGKCPGLPKQAERDIDKVLAASLRARDIVKRLLAFTRQTPPRKTRIDLNRIVTEGLKFFETRCSKEGVKLVCALSSRAPLVEGDPTQLTQVFVNLMANALQAMPGGGTLKVRTECRERYAMLFVEDTGAGMDRQVLENIFTPFFTTKDMDEGTGLGLPVAYGIVSSHGGTLRITSRPGEGTKCMVKLPAGEGPTDPQTGKGN